MPGSSPSFFALSPCPWARGPAAPGPSSAARSSRLCADSGFRVPAFYTAKYGYKLCLRLYLNGDGTGKKTHLSLFIVIMKGEYDALLPWPFRNKVSDGGGETGVLVLG